MSWETKLFSRVSLIYASQHFFFKLIISCVMGNKAILQGQPYLCLSALFQFPSFQAYNLLCCGKTKLFYSVGNIYASQHFSTFQSFKVHNLLCCGKQSYSTVTPYLCLSALFHFSSFFAYDLLCCGKRSYSTYI